jgi:hypothetical protein
MRTPLPAFRDFRPHHPGDHGEPRGPGVKAVGVCAICSSITVRLSPADGRPRHADCEEGLGPLVQVFDGEPNVPRYIRRP